MEWTGDAVILAVRRHGETAAIATLLAREHGCYSGLVHGGAGRTRRGVLQPGNRVDARWRARLPEHLGTLTCELTEPFAARVLDDGLRLAALNAACTIAASALPEREPHPPVFDGLVAFLTHLDDPDWPSFYVKWELGVLGELGFGLELGSCVATGANDSLVYVSPRSGQAVSAAAGEPYKDRLLPLPGFLLQPGATGSIADAADGMRLTGHFLAEHVFGDRYKALPEARTRLFRRLSDMARERP